MKRVLAVALLLFGCAVFVSNAQAVEYAHRLQVQEVYWDSGGAAREFQGLGDEADTTRTKAIDLRDADVEIVTAVAAGVANQIAQVFFVPSVAGGTADSVEYIVERSVDGTNWSSVVGNIVPVAAVGNTAVSGSGTAAGIGAAGDTYIGGIIGAQATQYTNATGNCFQIPFIRLKVLGDTSGGTLPLVRCYVAYYTRQIAQ